MKGIKGPTKEVLALANMLDQATKLRASAKPNPDHQRRKRAFWLVVPAAIMIACQAGRAEGPNSTANETTNAPRAALDSKLDLSPPPPRIWADGLGNGFSKGAREVELSLETGVGLGIHENHDLALASIRYGKILGRVRGECHWYQGNWELLGELFGGAQYSPHRAYLVGVTPLFRYTLATGSRWSPFIEGGFGPSLTDIGRPDISTTFEFNIQGGVGTHYFWDEHHAVTVQCRLFHLSNAGIAKPNLGVNSCVFLIGTSWFF